uniref:Uncharacterized protein n=1 Tax=Arundo donax TaxID=35708 RepID=A0A0A9C126_ARUDO
MTGNIAIDSITSRIFFTFQYLSNKTIHDSRRNCQPQ